MLHPSIKIDLDRLAPNQAGATDPSRVRDSLSRNSDLGNLRDTDIIAFLIMKTTGTAEARLNEYDKENANQRDRLFMIDAKWNEFCNVSRNGFSI